MRKTNKYLAVLSIVTGLIGFYLYFDYRDNPKPIFLKIAAGIALLSILSSFVAEKIAWVWDKIGLILGTINGTIILSVVFYCLLLPMALLRRLFRGDDGLMLKKKSEGSYFKERNHEYKAEDFDQVF